MHHVRPTMTICKKFVLSFSLLGFVVPCVRGDELQRAVARAMHGTRGTAIVLDVSSGRARAIHNEGTAARRVVRPGSAIKPFTLLALLSSGKTAAGEALACRRRFMVAGHKLDCGHPQIGQALDATAALAYSCNSYFTSMAVRLNPAEFQQALLKQGFGSPSGLAAKEATGTVALSATREQLQLQAIGEMNIAMTPLELASAYRKLALQRVLDSQDPALLTVFHGLEAATDYGTARLAQPPGALKVAGKTGTSLAEEGHWTHGWFVGFAPAAKPEIVVLVFVEHGAGPTDAAPIARQILAAYGEGRH